MANTRIVELIADLEQLRDRLRDRRDAVAGEPVRYQVLSQAVWALNEKIETLLAFNVAAHGAEYTAAAAQLEAGVTQLGEEIDRLDRWAEALEKIAAAAAAIAGAAG